MVYTVLDCFLKETKDILTITKIDKEICEKCFENKQACLNQLKEGHDGKILLIGNTPVGNIWKNKNEFGHIEITGFYIYEQFRRKGYGTLLLKNMPDAQVLYTQETNKTAQKGYEKSGWVKSELVGRFDAKHRRKRWFLYYNPKKIKASELTPYKKLEYDF